MPRNMKQRAITEKHKAPWCTWPWREYARDLQDLATAGAICDAWRAFFSSQTVQALSALRGYVCWFNRYEAFDRLIMEFACSQRRLEDTLRFLMLPGKQTPIVFTRVDIYDKRAWCTLPLDHFAPVSGLGPRTLDPFWQQEALSLAHTPLLAFGIPMHWTVPSSCFSVRWKSHRRERFAAMEFSHPQLDKRFENRRWCAEIHCPPGTTRAKIFPTLLAHVRTVAAQHLVTITE